VNTLAGPRASSWYFAYGSNMNPRRVSERGLEFDRVVAGSMPGLGLRFNKQAKDHPECGHANLVVAPGECAEGVLYELAGEAMIWRMDPFERAPVNYSREPVSVQSALGEITSWTYFANPAVQKDGLLPSRGYLAHLLEGRPYLSPDYYNALVAQPVSDG